MFVENGIVYADDKAPLVRAVSARLLSNMKILVNFNNGEKRIFDCSILPLDKPLYSPLKEKSILENFTVSHGTLTWLNEEIDISPDVLYRESVLYSA